jgi:hypothetical protein
VRGIDLNRVICVRNPLLLKITAQAQIGFLATTQARQFSYAKHAFLPPSKNNTFQSGNLISLSRFCNSRNSQQIAHKTKTKLPAVAGRESAVMVVL